MKFSKGKSGNPGGRPKGIPNKVTSDLRSRVSLFLDEEFDTIRAAFKKLSPEKKIRYYTDLLNYSIPKLSNTKMEIEFDQLTDEQLDLFIHSLKLLANDQEREN